VGRWAHTERCLSASRALPLGSTAADAANAAAADDDPERVAFYEDLAPFTIKLASPAAQAELVLAFAAFCGIPNANLAHVPSSHPLAALHDSFGRSAPVAAPLDGSGNGSR